MSEWASEGAKGVEELKKKKLRNIKDVLQRGWAEVFLKFIIIFRHQVTNILANGYGDEVLMFTLVNNIFNL